MVTHNLRLLPTECSRRASPALENNATTNLTFLGFPVAPKAVCSYNLKLHPPPSLPLTQKIHVYHLLKAKQIQKQKAIS